MSSQKKKMEHNNYSRKLPSFTPEEFDLHGIEKFAPGLSMKRKVEMRYDPKFSSEQPLDLFPSKRRSSFNNSIGKQMYSMKSKLRSAIHEKKKARVQKCLKSQPLTRNERIYLNKLSELKKQIKARLESFEQIEYHESLSKLYYLILEQDSTRKWDYKDLYQHCVKIFNEIHQLRR
ncbi:hypothetical protein [Candidatus Lokiarchaeum ossiferum]|uniref:hypothetical protein n=1 Tax=Candidatus Lokiarchaeum ossiferum TaxID=2951803 RepID=UPI00352ECEDD